VSHTTRDTISCLQRRLSSLPMPLRKPAV
jgi:hypothetical protein